MKTILINILKNQYNTPKRIYFIRIIDLKKLYLCRKRHPKERYNNSPISNVILAVADFYACCKLKLNFNTYVKINIENFPSFKIFIGIMMKKNGSI